MYQKILVALDHSPARSNLLEEAIGMAKVMNADLMLVHVLSAYDEASPGLPVRGYHSYYPIINSVAWETYRERWTTYEQDRLAELQQLAEEANTLGIRTELTQTAGNPGRVICDVARSWNADLIVVGNRGRVGLSEFLLGSVSNYVMHHAPCSVLVAHNATTEANALAQSDAEASVTVQR